MKDLFLLFVCIIMSAFVIAFLSYRGSYTDPLAQATTSEQIHRIQVGNNTYWIPNYKEVSK
jgi:hypothetical protein